MLDDFQQAPREIIFLTDREEDVDLLQRRFSELANVVQQTLPSLGVEVNINYLSHRFLVDFDKKRREDAIIFYISEHSLILPNGRRRFPTMLVDLVKKMGFPDLTVIYDDGTEDKQILDKISEECFPDVDDVEDEFELEGPQHSTVSNPNSALVKYSDSPRALSTSVSQNNHCAFFSGNKLGMGTTAAASITLGSLMAAGVIALTPIAILALAASAFACVCFLMWHVGGVLEKAEAKNQAKAIEPLRLYAAA